MLVRLHSQAITTPKIRAAIQASIDPAWKVGERYGISERTVLKWRHRDNVEDRSHSPHRLQSEVGQKTIWGIVFPLNADPRSGSCGSYSAQDTFDLA